MRRGVDKDGSEALLAAVDRHVGGRIRTRRREIGMSQSALGEKAGVASQQIAKYETGENGIPAARLWMIAHAIGLETGQLFEGLDASGLDAEADPTRDPDAMARHIGALDESHKLAEAFRRITNPRTRELLVVLSRELAAKN